MPTTYDRRSFLQTVGALSAATLFNSGYRENAALAEERDTRTNPRVAQEVVQRTYSAMCKVLVPTDFGSIPGERRNPKIGSGVLIETPPDLAEIVGPNRLVVLSVAHNFAETPAGAEIGLKFYRGGVAQVGEEISLSARVLASDRSFKRADDVAFLVIDVPKDPDLAHYLKTKALPLESSEHLTQFAPVASVGFSNAKLTPLDNLRIIDAQPQSHSGNRRLLLAGFVEPGHSGAPLVNAEGRVIGVVSGADKRKRSIAAGEELDFRATWPLLALSGGTQSDHIRAIRTHDLKHIPPDVQQSTGRVLGPSVMAINAFAAKVRETFSAALVEAAARLTETRALVSRVRSSEIGRSQQDLLIEALQAKLSNEGEKLFGHIGGIPAEISEQIDHLDAFE